MLAINGVGVTVAVCSGDAGVERVGVTVAVTGGVIPAGVTGGVTAGVTGGVTAGVTVGVPEVSARTSPKSATALSFAGAVTVTTFAVVLENPFGSVSWTTYSPGARFRNSYDPSGPVVVVAITALVFGLRSWTITVPIPASPGPRVPLLLVSLKTTPLMLARPGVVAAVGVRVGVSVGV
jgi:hypothetical protein